MPVQSQTAIPRLTNPTAADLAPCGLPSRYSFFNASATVRTFNMTADCVFGAEAFNPANSFLEFTAGAFIINGNGHSISGLGQVISAYGAGVIVNLNNVIIRRSGRANNALLITSSNASLNARNIIFTDNNGLSLATVILGSISFENVQAYDNRLSSAVLTSSTSGSMTINNGIFLRNAGIANVLNAEGSGSAMNLQGCMTFTGNVQADSVTAAANTRTGSVTATLTDSSTGACPSRGFSYWLSLTPQKKSKKTATPRPSPTARPLATTCIDLNQATGIVVRATYGLASGVQCQRLGGGGIGVQAIVDGGFIDAVDVWGYVEQGVEVCFPQAGELLFLDARTMPRAIAPLAATVVNGMTCGAIETPGSIVLMPAG